MDEGQLSAYIREILKEKKVKEGTCGYGIDGEIGKKPAGPDMLQENWEKRQLLIRAGIIK
jgi:hypothetical protein